MVQKPFLGMPLGRDWVVSTAMPMEKISEAVQLYWDQWQMKMNALVGYTEMFEVRPLLDYVHDEFEEFEGERFAIHSSVVVYQVMESLN